METIEVLAHVFARLAPMAVIAIVGALLLAPVLGRWKWLVGDDRDTQPSWDDYCDDPDCDDCLTRLFDCDGCGNTYDIKGSCEYRTYNEDGNKHDYLICQGCYHEIMDSWA